MKFILGKKLGMTQVFSPNGDILPVTRVTAGPCQITQVKNSGKDNSVAVEIGFEEVKDFRVNKPKAGHLNDLKPVRHLRSFLTESVEGLNRGDVVAVDTFSVGDIVTVEGISKGKGFAGVVKRHGFHGAPASHGHKHDLRAPGSIGAGGVQRVFKGMRMAGRMGGGPVTVKNLEVVEIHPETNEIYIKGAIPGARNGLVKISCPGKLSVNKAASSAEPVSENVSVEAEQVNA
ncbi:MAG: 50S ribosomal protein L3 [Patescibacteria group bacterium]